MTSAPDPGALDRSAPSWVGLSTTQCHVKRIQRGIPVPDSWPYLEATVRAHVTRCIRGTELPPDCHLDDLVQLVLYHVLVNISQFQVSPQASFAGWVCWIARRRAISMWRTHRRDVLSRSEPEERALDTMVEDDTSPVTLAHLRDVEASVRRAVATLRKSDQRVLQLRENEGLAFEEVARAMRYAHAATARCRYHRAVQRRRRLLQAAYRVDDV